MYPAAEWALIHFCGLDDERSWETGSKRPTHVHTNLDVIDFDMGTLAEGRDRPLDKVAYQASNRMGNRRVFIDRPFVISYYRFQPVQYRE